MSEKPEIPEVPPVPEQAEETAQTVTPSEPKAEIAAAGAPQAHTSVWSLMLGVLTSPGSTLAQVARERRVGQAALIVAGLSLFGLLTALLGISSDDLDLTLHVMGQEVPLDPLTVRQVGRQFVLSWGLLTVLLQVICWFVRAGVYNLLGETMGDQGDGRAMLAVLGFANMPSLFSPILQAAAAGLGLPVLSFLFGLAVAIWVWVLDVIAIRSALQTSTGKAVAIFLIPAAVTIGFLILSLVFLIMALAPTVPTT